MIYKQQLEQIRTTLFNKRADMISEINTLPDGNLYIQVKGGRYYYFQRFKKKGNRKKEHRYGISDDHDLIFALFMKRYVENALSAVEQDIEILDCAIQDFKPVD